MTDFIIGNVLIINLLTCIDFLCFITNSTINVMFDSLVSNYKTICSKFLIILNKTLRSISVISQIPTFNRNPLKICKTPKFGNIDFLLVPYCK